MIRLLSLMLALTMLGAACGDDDAGDRATTETSATTTGTVTLLTHDSFAVSDTTFATFTEQTGIEVEVLRAGDAGSVVNQAILTAGSPLGDVLFGIDNTFLSRALDADLFTPYEAAGLDTVPADLLLDDQFRVTPIDTGDVCLNVDVAALAAAELPIPDSLDDLIDPDYADTLVVENPATSSPGLAFLLATVAAYGDEGWIDWWSALRANGVVVEDGWEQAYYGTFSGSAGSTGDRPIVVSYASSPAAEMIFAEQPLDDAPTAVVAESCFRQIEFAGILTGTEHESEAQALVDFLLTDTFQSDIPLSMFVYPAVEGIDLPAEFVEFGVRVDDAFFVEADRIAANRDDWIAEWTDVVLR